MSEAKLIFNVTFGHDPECGTYAANVFSESDHKMCSIEAVSLKMVLAEVSKRIRKQHRHLLKFPLPEPGKIVTIDNGHSNLIIPARN